MALQNRDAVAANITARWAWLEAPGVGDTTSFCGRELFSGEALGQLVGGVSLAVQAEDTAVVRLSPGASC